MFEKVEEKSFFGPWRQDEWVLGVPPSIIVRNRAPCGAGLARKVLWDDNLAPFSSDKIRAKILDLGYGGARTDFIAAEGEQIVIQKHFSSQPSTKGGPIPHYNGGRKP